jgi:hypothetical protein
MDNAESTDESGATGSSSPGSVGGSGGVQDASFTPADIGQGVAPTTGVPGNACDIANDLVARGWSKEGASAIVGNMMSESNLNPAAYNPNDVGSPAGGLVQWRGPRLKALQSYSSSRGLDWRTQEAQLGYLDQEARGSHAGIGGATLVSGAGGIEGAIKAAASYERYQGWDTNSAQYRTRAAQAGGVYNECFNGGVETVGGETPTQVEGYQGGTQEASTDGTLDGSGGGTGQGEVTPTKGTKGAYAEGTGGGSINWGQKVSPNFTLGQLCPTSKFHEGMNPTGSGQLSADEIIRNLSVVAMNVLEPMLSSFGRVTVMSGYRSLAYNNGLRAKGKGAAKNSDHIKGQAVDVKVPGVAPSKVAAWVERNIPTAAGVGRYPSFTHVSYYAGGSKGMRRWGRN